MPLLHDPASFSRVILSGKCAHAGIEQDRFGLVEIPFHSTYENFGNSKPGFLVKWNASKVFSGPPVNVHTAQSTKFVDSINFSFKKRKAKMNMNLRRCLCYLILNRLELFPVYLLYLRP